MVEKNTTLKLQIIPSSNMFKVVGWDEWKNALKVRVCSKPIKGKANCELTKKLEEFFDSPIKIISGHKSKEKRIIIQGKNLDEIKTRLAKLSNF